MGGDNSYDYNYDNDNDKYDKRNRTETNSFFAAANAPPANSLQAPAATTTHEKMTATTRGLKDSVGWASARQALVEGGAKGGGRGRGRGGRGGRGEGGGRLGGRGRAGVSPPRSTRTLHLSKINDDSL